MVALSAGCGSIILSMIDAPPPSWAVMDYWLIALAIIGGLLNRWRGGWLLGPGATGRRMILAAATTAWVLALLQSGANTEAALFASCFWGLSYLGWVPGWGSYMDMGRSGKPDNEFLRPLLNLFFADTGNNLARDFAGMTIRGLVVTAPAGAVLAYWYLTAGLIYAASGLAMGAVYWLAWKVGEAGMFGVKFWRVKNFEAGPPLGEFLFGTWVWTALYVGIKV